MTPSASDLTWVMPAFHEGPDMYVIHRFGSVDGYEASACWRMVRDGWVNRHPNARCFVCGDVGKASPVTQRPTGLELHHLSYRGYLGFEPGDASNGWNVRDQLVPLCPPHHYEVERRIRAGTPRAAPHIAYRDEYAARAGGRLRHMTSEISEV